MWVGLIQSAEGLKRLRSPEKEIILPQNSLQIWDCDISSCGNSQPALQISNLRTPTGEQAIPYNLFLSLYTHTHTHTLLVLYLWRTQTNTDDLVKEACSHILK